MANAFPLLLVAGAAAVLLTSKKKKKGNGNGAVGTKEMVAASGSSGGFDWQVREATKGEGFGISYLAEYRVTGSSVWTQLGFQPTVEDAKNIALEAIAGELGKAADEKGLGFNWEPAIAVNQENLRKQFPNVTLTRLQSGEMMRGNKKCNWCVASIDPPIEQGAYFGIGVCPGTPQDSFVGPSIAHVKTALEVGG